MTAFQYDWNMLPIGQQLWYGASAVSTKNIRRCRLQRPTTSAEYWTMVKKAAASHASD